MLPHEVLFGWAAHSSGGVGYHAQHSQLGLFFLWPKVQVFVIRGGGGSQRDIFHAGDESPFPALQVLYVGVLYPKQLKNGL